MGVTALKDFDPRERRDDHGRWTQNFGGGATVEWDGAQGTVHSPYDKRFVDGVKRLGGRWNPKRKVWSVPAKRSTDLERLMTSTYGRAEGGSDIGSIPTGVSVQQANGKVIVRSPYNEQFVAAARGLGGEWNRQERAWQFPAHRADAVGAALRTHYPAQAQPPRRAAGGAYNMDVEDLRSFTDPVSRYLVSTYAASTRELRFFPDGRIVTRAGPVVLPAKLQAYVNEHGYGGFAKALGAFDLFDVLAMEFSQLGELPPGDWDYGPVQVAVSRDGALSVSTTTRKSANATSASESSDDRCHRQGRVHRRHQHGPSDPR